MKIDIHTHILPKELPDFSEKYDEGRWPRISHPQKGSARILVNGEIFREIEENCWNPKKRLEECDASGVDIQVLSTVPVMFGYWAKPDQALQWSQTLNDHLAAAIRDHPKRFAGLGTVPLQEPELAAKELGRCVKDLGLAGVQIGSHVNAWNLDEPPLLPFFQEAENLGGAIFVHPWDMMGRERMPKYFLPWLVGMPAETSLAICSVIFGGILERLPRLRLAFAHGGGAFPMTLGRIERAFHARPDLCRVHIQKSPREYVRKIYVDSLVHDAGALKHLISVFGDERIALGTDYPFPLGEPSPGKLIESAEWLDRKSKDRLLGGVALQFLGLNRREAAKN